MEPLWSQLIALIPPHIDTHPWGGCHRPRIPRSDHLRQTRPGPLVSEIRRLQLLGHH